MRARRPRRRRTESNRVRVQITRSLHTPVAGSFRINFTRPSGSVSRLMTALPSNISGVRFHRVEHVGEHLGPLGTGTRGNACPRRTHDSSASGWSLEQELSVPFRPVPCRSPSPAHDSARGKNPSGAAPQFNQCHFGNCALTAGKYPTRSAKRPYHRRSLPRRRSGLAMTLIRPRPLATPPNQRRPHGGCRHDRPGTAQDETAQ